VPARNVLAAGVTLAWLALAGAACEDVPRRPSVETQFFIVHHREDRPPTADELAALDAHFRTVGMGLLGLPLPDRPFDVHLYRDAADLAANGPCWDIAAGCTFGRHVHAPPDFGTLTHELVHAYLHERCGGLSELLNEGLAVALSGVSHDGEVGATDPSAFETTVAYRRAERSGDADQSFAGELVAWLATWYGLDAVVDAACALPRDAGRARIERELEERFGAPLAELYVRAVAAPDRPTAPCAWDALRTRTLAVDAEELVVPRPLPDPISLPAGAVYARARVAAGNVGGGLYQCGAAFGPDVAVWPNTGAPGIAVEHWAPLAADGGYLLAASTVTGAPAEGGVAVTLLDRAPLADVCDPAGAADLHAGFTVIALSVAGAVLDDPALDPDGTAVADSAGQFVLMERARVNADTREVVWLCPGACAPPSPAACTRAGAINGTAGAPFDPGTYTLVVVWPDAYEYVQDCPDCADYRKLDLEVVAAP
jgi:hypothetical protein